MQCSRCLDIDIGKEKTASKEAVFVLIAPLDVIVVFLLAVETGLVVIRVGIRVGARDDVHVTTVDPPRIAVIGVVIVPKAVFSTRDRDLRSSRSPCRP